MLGALSDVSQLRCQSTYRYSHRMQLLDSQDLSRYERQLALAEFGEEGQRRLKAASVLIIGAGGLGSPAATYLAAAGVGTIGLVDHDRVELSNLHRQPLHASSDVGRKKLLSAKERLNNLNPLVHIKLYDEWFSAANAMQIAANYDLIIDGTDNFATRYLVNDVCVLQRKPNVYGSVFRFDGQASVFCMPNGPCYRCLHPTPPPPSSVPNCAEGGVLGVLPGLVGTIQATEAIKILTGIGSTLAGRLLMIDALSMRFQSIAIAPDPACPACGTRTLTTLIDYDQFCGDGKRTANTIHKEHTGEQQGEVVLEIDGQTLTDWLNASTAATIIDVREPEETAAGTIDGSLLIPMGVLKQSIPEIPRDSRIVVVCASGIRSARAGQWLLDAGFTQVFSLAGGIRQLSGKPLSSNT